MIKEIKYVIILLSLLTTTCFADENLHTSVDNAMIEAGNGNSNQVYHLCINDGDDALKIVAGYRKNPDVQIRLAVGFCAASVKGKLGFDTLTDLVNDSDNEVEENAISALFGVYSAEEIRQYGFKYLKKNLLHLARTHRISDYSYPMLAYFGPDQDISKTLNDQYNHDRKDRSASAHNIALDVTLAQLRDQGALTRLSDLLKSGSVDGIVVFLDLVKHISRPFILADATELLNDERETQIRRGGIGEAIIPARPLIDLCDDTPVPQHPKPTRLRVCDRALYVLASKAKIDVGVDLITYALRPFTNDELAAAYKILKAHFQDLEVKEAVKH